MMIFQKRPLVVAVLGALAAQASFVANAQNTDASTQDAEVVVTANKVTQSALKVGASLSAVSSDDIREKGVTDAKALTDLMPNTQISQAGNSSVVVNIRGIENTNTTALGEPAAAFHIDGIYLGRMSGAGSAFFDIERVEVLRGPQGTLYGRNANAGVVNVITKAPTNKREGFVSVDVGNLGQKRVDGAYNLPVNDSLALRAAFSTNRRDGYSETKTATNGFTQNQDSVHTDSFRLQGLLKISPQTSLNVSYDQSTNKTTGPNYYNLTAGIPDKLVDTGVLIQGKFNDKASGFKTELKSDLGFANLTYIYGQRNTKNKEDYATGPLILLTKFTFEQNSHEIRLSSNDTASPLQWVAGYFQYKETGKDGQLDGNAPFYLFGPAPGPAPFGPDQCGGFAACYPGLQFQDYLIQNDSKALFGQATYSLNDTSRVIVGARHTADEKSRNSQQVLSFSGVDYNTATPGNAATPLFGDASWRSSTYKLGYELDISATKMLYTSISTGFKSGGFNDGDTRADPSLIYAPEKITAYEAGLNGKFFDNALQLTSSVFHYDYSDMQKSGIVNGQSKTTNTGKATVDGVEVSARYRVSSAGRIDTALGLLEAKYKNYTTPNGTDYAGKKLDKTPTVTLNVGYTHNWNLESGARLTGYLGTKYSASYVTTDTGDVAVAPTQFTQKAYTKSSASLTWAAEDDSMDVQFYVRNIENKSQLMGSVAFFGANYGYMSEPRTLGARATFRF
ncbi:TonB-dependent receptor [Leptothrix cholodnii SP-6]|uniref:TonB-dependent receptor n=1 Tax=Leptothrix cholodnii (strain ATCC 51168 / LMG 8142 / SP-6) TaxID=395495 RepID=B1Y1A3_LEPCP|nr:TonB-dependent receptor [Leptothrix cholodnii]ACB33080.1 TonB-dependent receptor [Leptothrix cholodnii SP-6]